MSGTTMCQRTTERVARNDAQDRADSRMVRDLLIVDKGTRVPSRHGLPMAAVPIG